MLSPALVALNRDAFVIEARAETTVDLDAPPGDTSLDELELDERTAEAA